MNHHTDALWDTAHAFMPYPTAPVPNAPTGPLAGLSFGVKDLYHVKGYPTSGGQPFMLALSGIQQRTAPVVQTLLNAGARFAGKTITDELAYSMNGQNAHFGSPINGADPLRISGGSSSGSASAVSNRLCDFALGSDTGGSVRAPANHCGLVGMRPSHGRIPLDDTLALSPSLDTCGWFTRDVPTFARVADVLFGEDAHPLPDSVRLLVPNDIWGLATPAAVKALKPVRGQIEECLGKARAVNIALDDFDTMFWHFRAIQGREAWDVDGGFIQRFAPVLGPGVAERFQWASELSDQKVAAAQVFRQRWRAHIGGILGTDGVLLMPTMPDVAPLISSSEVELNDYRNRATRMLCGAGLAGLPQLSLPLAQRLGAPLGLSLVGPVGSDRSLVRLAERIHAAMG